MKKVVVTLDDSFKECPIEVYMDESNLKEFIAFVNGQMEDGGGMFSRYEVVE